MKKTDLACGLIGLFLVQNAWSASIDSIQAQIKPNETQIDISGSGLAGYTKEVKNSPPQLVLTFDDATLAEAAKQKLDSSALGPNVIQVSSYAMAGGKARIVIDFAKTPKYLVDGSDQKISLHLTAPASGQETKSEMKVADNDALTTIMSAETQQKFTGSPITLKLKDADVHEVLRLISDASGFNIVIHPSVTGKITVSLDQVPWDQALDVVLTTLKLGAERNDSVLRVLPKDLLVKEKQDDMDAKKVSTQAAPRITRVFPISYADINNLSGLLQSFTNSQNTAPGSSGIPATILVDVNTQSLVVRDTADNVERIRKMIQLLDVQTPQVLLESKFAEASETFTNELDGNISLSGPGYGFALNSPPATTSASSALAGSSSGGGSGGSRTNSVTLNIVKTLSLQAFINYQESLSKVKIVSSPKVVVLSGKSANISQATSIAVQNSVLGTGGGVQTAVQQISAKTSLDVTPRVTNDGSVFMKLTINRDAFNFANPQLPSTSPRTMQTEVIVDSGNTLVIGGVLDMDENIAEQGIPFLRKLPIIGWLFGSDTYSKDKTEIMFFVTPRILNQKKTALGLEGTEPPKT